MSTGILFLIPTPLGGNNVDFILPPAVLKITQDIDEFIVENEKSARQFLKFCGVKTPQSQLLIHELNKHEQNIFEKHFFENLLKGKNVGLLSEVGCPAIADPGAAIIREAHKQNIRIIPLTGPSSLLLALIASGLNGQNFCFHGYLPKEKDERKSFLKKIEKESAQKKQTQLFIETPYRNNATLSDILICCNSETELCIAADITLENEFIKTKKIVDWKINIPDLNKRVAVFLILAKT